MGLRHELTRWIIAKSGTCNINSDIKVPLTVKVIDSSGNNVFALPGGFLRIYLLKGK
jgi:hypothetical protein